MKEQPNYYSIITADVRYDKDLKPNAKILYSEIAALSYSKGFCFASNVHFAELYGVNRATISRWISQLAKKEYIAISLVYKPNSKEVKERRLFINDSAKNKMKRLSKVEKSHSVMTKESQPLLEKSHSHNDEKIIGNNTSINITSINKKNKQKKVCVSENSVLEVLENSNLDLSKFSEEQIKILNSVKNTTENREEISKSLKANSERKKVAPKKESVKSEHVERIYKSYPTTCPTKKNNTGKSRKVGAKKSKQILIIEQLLRTFNVSELEKYVNKYISDCTASKTYIKNFQTFLNSIKENGIPVEEENTIKKGTENGKDFTPTVYQTPLLR